MYSKEEMQELFVKLYKKKGKPITIEDLAKELGVCGCTVRKWIKQTNAYDNCADVFVHVKNHCAVLKKSITKQPIG